MVAKVWPGFSLASFWAASLRSSSYTSGSNCSAACGSPCSMAERIDVTSFMIRSHSLASARQDAEPSPEVSLIVGLRELNPASAGCRRRPRRLGDIRRPCARTGRPGDERPPLGGRDRLPQPGRVSSRAGAGPAPNCLASRRISWDRFPIRPICPICRGRPRALTQRAHVQCNPTRMTAQLSAIAQLDRLAAGRENTPN